MRLIYLLIGSILRPFMDIKWVCRFSAYYVDIHDYPVKCGGDGSPSHFYTYTCWNCGKEFTI